MKDEIKQRVNEAISQLDLGSEGLAEAEKVLIALRDAGNNVGDMMSKLARAKQQTDRTKRALAKQGFV